MMLVAMFFRALLACLRHYFDDADSFRYFA